MLIGLFCAGFLFSDETAFAVGTLDHADCGICGFVYRFLRRLVIGGGNFDAVFGSADIDQFNLDIIDCRLCASERSSDDINAVGLVGC